MVIGAERKICQGVRERDCVKTTLYAPFCPNEHKCAPHLQYKRLLQLIAPPATMASRCGAVAAILVAMLSPALSWVARPNASQSAGSTRLGFSRTRPSGDACWVHPTYPRSLPRSKGLPALRMGEAEDAIEAEVRAMRASKIKQTLEEMSIATKGVYEVGLSCCLSTAS